MHLPLASSAASGNGMNKKAPASSAAPSSWRTHCCGGGMRVQAAQEMRERLFALLGEDIAKGLVAGTFHSLCVSVLRRHIHHLQGFDFDRQVQGGVQEGRCPTQEQHWMHGSSSMMRGRALRRWLRAPAAQCAAQRASQGVVGPWLPSTWLDPPPVGRPTPTACAPGGPQSFLGVPPGHLQAFTCKRQGACTTPAALEPRALLAPSEHSVVFVACQLRHGTALTPPAPPAHLVVSSSPQGLQHLRRGQLNSSAEEGANRGGGLSGGPGAAQPAQCGLDSAAQRV